MRRIESCEWVRSHHKAPNFGGHEDGICFSMVSLELHVNESYCIMWMRHVTSQDAQFWWHHGNEKVFYGSICESCECVMLSRVALSEWVVLFHQNESCRVISRRIVAVPYTRNRFSQYHVWKMWMSPVESCRIINCGSTIHTKSFFTVSYVNNVNVFRWVMSHCVCEWV